MNIEQLSKTSPCSNFLNELLSITTTEKNWSWYIVPGFTQLKNSVNDDQTMIIDIAAALLGMKYSFEQLIVQFSESTTQNQNKIDKFFFLIKQPEHTLDTEFHATIQKICDYFQIKPNCLIKSSFNQTTLSISDFNTVEKVNNETQKVIDFLVVNFWSLFKDQHQQILNIRAATEYEAVSEPQTNFGRQARQLKVNQILKQLNISR